MATATTAPHRRSPWKNRVVLPCGRCGTPDGKIGKGMTRPARCDGTRFGYTAKICLGCHQGLYMAARRQIKRLGQPTLRQQAEVNARRAEALKQHLRAASAFIPVVSGCPCHRFRMRFRTECDLCGVGGAISVFDGSEFDIEGRICHQCREELREERAEIRSVELRSQPCYGPDGGHLHANHENRRPGLPVLTPGFTREDLTPRAAVRLILAETKGVFPRRVPA